MPVWVVIRLVVTAIWALLILGHSTVPPGDPLERIRAYSRNLEFNFLSWSLNALWLKMNQSALGAIYYMPVESHRELVLEYLDLVGQIQRVEGQLNSIYADPGIDDPESASATIREDLEELYDQRSRIGPMAESILQYQTSTVVAEVGLSVGGQPLPPILYHSTPLPTALIVSPRHTIRQEANISLVPDLTVDKRITLENAVDQNLDVSSLVVDIGGIGIYPTMIVQTTNLNFLTEVVAHEWIHNYFTLRPLGMFYLTSQEARIINETAATIGGKEIGRLVMERYYPDLLPPPPPPPPDPDEPPPEPVFDFRHEMFITRVTVDELLAQGKIEEAEAYMEERRIFFWEHGYRHIRKLNQAYFAFYGAYADEPGGPAGEDPVGEAVRTFRARSPSLAAFLKQIAWTTSFEQLQRAIEEFSS